MCLFSDDFAAAAVDVHDDSSFNHLEPKIGHFEIFCKFLLIDFYFAVLSTDL